MRRFQAATNLLVIATICLSFPLLCFAQQSSVNNKAYNKSRPGSVNDTDLSSINKLIGSNRLEVAEQLVRKHLSRYPEDSDYLIVLSRILHKNGKSKDALAMLRLARTFTKSYEDIYIIEAGILNSINQEEACKGKNALVDDYYLYTDANKFSEFKKRVGQIQRGQRELQLGISFDKLNNNRGDWYSENIRNNWESCPGHDFYLGYNAVNRYELDDAEFFTGLGLEYDVAGLNLEYRQSRDKGILAKKSLLGVVNLKTDFSVDLLMTGSLKKYNGIETQTLGGGFDYYFDNYQLMFVVEQTNYSALIANLAGSNTRKYYLAYYFNKSKYIRYGYVTGEELDYDGSQNPPYSKVKTVLLTAAIPLTENITIVTDVKRHHFFGYYEQNGISISLRYKY